MMEFIIQYYTTDFQKEMILLYINYPGLYVLGWLICALYASLVFYKILEDKMVIEYVKALIIKILRD